MNLASLSKIRSRFQPGALARLALGLALALAAVQGLVVALSLASPRDGGRVAQWHKSRESFQKLPEEVYHLDRFRAVRGRVADENGNPLANAHVRCVKIEALVKLGEIGGGGEALDFGLPDRRRDFDRRARAL